MRAFLPKQAYVRVLIIMSAFALFVVAAFTLYLSFTFSEYAIDEVARVNKQEVHHTADNIEFLLEKLRAYAVTMYEDQAIRAWISSEKDDPIMFVSASNRLSKLLSTEPFIESVCLINKQKRQIYESRSMLHSFEAFPDQGLLSLIEQTRPTLSLDYREVNGKPNLSMTIPSTPFRQEYNGYVVLMLDIGLLQRHFLQSEENPNVNTLMFVETDIPLASGVSTEAAAALNAGRETANPDRSFQVVLEGEKWLVHYDALETQRWVFYRMMRISDINQRTTKFRNTIIISFLGLLCLLFTMLLWYSKRTLQPLDSLAEKVQDMIGHELPNDAGRPHALREYNVIEQGIEALQGKVDSLGSSINQHRSVIKTDYLRQWILLGRMTGATRDLLCVDTDILQSDKINLAVLRIESYQHFKDNHDFSAIRRVKQSICELAQDQFRQAGSPAEAVDMGADCLVLLIGNGSDNLEPIKQVCASVNDRVKGDIPSGLAIALSGARRFDDDLRQTYDTAYEISMLKYIWGREQVYDEADYEAYMQVVQVLPDDSTLEQILQSVRAGNLEQAMEAVDMLIAQMRTMTYANGKFFLTLCIYTIFKTFSRHTSLNDFVGIQGQLDMFHSLGDASDWLKSEIGKIYESIQKGKKSGRREEALSEIVEYVHANLHNPMLTLDDISEHVSLSGRYVRQLFKEAFDTTLSEYILDKRIERVKTLLETTGLPIGDIADHAGFLTRSHFFTVFKKATGLTPNQYRQDFDKQ